MSQTPSHRRRIGKNDYCPNTDPRDVNPFKYDESKSRDWLDGWKEAEDSYLAREVQKENYIEKREKLTNALRFFAQMIREEIAPIEQAIEELVDVLMDDQE